MGEFLPALEWLRHIDQIQGSILNENTSLKSELQQLRDSVQKLSAFAEPRPRAFI
jgi:regulator of replication initiation timing